MLTSNSLAMWMPELSAIQIKKLQRLLIDERMAELEAIRDAGWCESDKEFDQWLTLREQHYLERKAAR